MSKSLNKFGNTPNECVQTTDGRTVWLNRSVAVVVVLSCLFEGKLYVAMVKRGPNLDSPDMWCLPCGYLDADEQIGMAAWRELYEETGIDIETLKCDVILDDGLAISSKVMTDMTMPFAISSDPAQNRQNVSMCYGALIAVDSLPPITIEHAEPGELTEAKWQPIAFPLLNRRQMAFRHGDRILSYFQKLPDKYIWSLVTKAIDSPGEAHTIVTNVK